MHTKPARDSPKKLTSLCGEFDGPTHKQGGTLLRRISVGSTICPVKETNTFDVECHVGIEVKVPRTVNPQSFVCVIACTSEVQNFRFAATQNTEIVPEHPEVVLRHCSRELDARSGPSCVSTARGDPERGFQRPDEKVLTIVPCIKSCSEVCGKVVVKSHGKSDETSEGNSRS